MHRFVLFTHRSENLLNLLLGNCIVAENKRKTTWRRTQQSWQWATWKSGGKLSFLSICRYSLIEMWFEISMHPSWERKTDKVSFIYCELVQALQRSKLMFPHKISRISRVIQIIAQLCVPDLLLFSVSLKRLSILFVWSLRVPRKRIIIDWNLSNIITSYKKIVRFIVSP